MSTELIRRYLEKLVETKKPVQVVLQGGQPPIGPAIVEHAPDEDGDVRLYRMMQLANFGTDPKNLKIVKIPIIFPWQSVLYVLEEPQNVDGDKLIADLGQNRTASGIIVPGRG